MLRTPTELREHCAGLGIDLPCVDRVGQGPLPVWAPPEFPHPPGTALPEILRLSWSQDGQPAEISLTWYDPATVRYVARLK